jgi:hypothetical protein
MYLCLLVVTVFAFSIFDVNAVLVSSLHLSFFDPGSIRRRMGLKLSSPTNRQWDNFSSNKTTMWFEICMSSKVWSNCTPEKAVGPDSQSYISDPLAGL